VPWITWECHGNGNRLLGVGINGNVAVPELSRLIVFGYIAVLLLYSESLTCMASSQVS